MFDSAGHHRHVVADLPYTVACRALVGQDLQPWAAGQANGVSAMRPAIRAVGLSAFDITFGREHDLGVELLGTQPQRLSTKEAVWANVSGPVTVLRFSVPTTPAWRSTSADAAHGPQQRVVIEGFEQHCSGSVVQVQRWRG
jgi:hypothetical protein